MALLARSTEGSTVTTYAAAVVVLASSLSLTGCASDEEKALRTHEAMATAVAENKDDCAKMAGFGWPSPTAAK